MSSKTLVAFDFDHTLIDDNSDIYVQKLAPNGIPPEIKSQYSDKGWTNYMGAIFKFLHQNGTRKSEILDCMREIRLTKGMPELLRHLAENDCETVIISDSNSVFIRCILEHSHLQDTVAAVFTNPAKFDDEGCLTIKYFHTQDWCDLSTINLCKGRILEDYIVGREKDGVGFDRVYYVGDGSNDLCPCLTLRETDFACPRVNFTLWKKLQKSLSNNNGEAMENLGIKAKIVPWNDGWNLLEAIKANSVGERKAEFAK